MINHTLQVIAVYVLLGALLVSQNLEWTVHFAIFALFILIDNLAKREGRWLGQAEILPTLIQAQEALKEADNLIKDLKDEQHR